MSEVGEGKNSNLLVDFDFFRNVGFCSQREEGSVDFPYDAGLSRVWRYENDGTTFFVEGIQNWILNVGKDDISHLRRIDARLAHIVEKPAGGRREIRTGADIEDRQAVSGAQECHVAVWTVAVRGHAVCGKQRLKLRFRKIGKEKFERQRHVTIADDDQLSLSDGQPAKRLSTAHNLYDQLANITPDKGSIHDPRDWLLAEALANAANATTQEEDT